ncbi:MAG TPA: hypothetical protein VNW68_05640 [Candidatus Limnocylindria bacterium]|nr:hypothetical protein [Candidatus Limnocylindria bacterium]
MPDADLPGHARAVLDIGGLCAEGGPFVIAHPWPEGVPLVIVGGIFGLFVFGGLTLAGAYMAGRGGGVASGRRTR